MGRWEPDARGRLAKAALDLYSERGFEQTTAAEIARRAGLTERTFFRHYADKREVLFASSPAMQDVFVAAVAGAEPSAAAMEALAAGYDAVSGFFADRRDFARKRQDVVLQNAELLERELMKLASLAAALAGALRQRGVAPAEASLAAEAGVAVFKVGFERWVAPGEERDMAQLMRAALAELGSLAGGA
ncbi:TetR family transcriptional regulator [Streptomyces sp. NPDC047002]|uniref:TetR family transcriptional regulator n=1 Tax=Streptomyces sp. NPDC047002 TaxID=3155475 RepID=UPI003456A6A4